MSWLHIIAGAIVMTFLIVFIAFIAMEYGPKWVRRFVNTQWHRRWSKRRN